jgi:integrase
MAQKVRSSKLETRSVRLRLSIRKKPYFVKIARGLSLGYRRTKTAGTWVVRVTRDNSDWTQALGKADDHEETGSDILTFDEAQNRARVIARAGQPGGDNTVKGALDRYESDLETRGADVDNVKRARHHLSAKLTKKAVGALTTNDLREWRNELATKMKAASVNRTANALRAALNLAAETDERISNRKAWKDGLKAIADASEARNIVLSEQDVRAIIAGAYGDSEQFGEFVEVIAVTGTRPSQAARLQGEDVQSVFDAKTKTWQPRLMMPTSRKGRGKKKITHRPVPITESLTERLANRKGTLLLRPDGGTWNKSNHARRFAEAVKAAGLDPSVVTIYALRHTSIVRQLLANVPVRVVAALHDTSVAMIEKNYSKYIADHADELARPTLLETSAEIVRIADHSDESTRAAPLETSAEIIPLKREVPG